MPAARPDSVQYRAARIECAGTWRRDASLPLPCFANHRIPSVFRPRRCIRSVQPGAKRPQSRHGGDGPLAVSESRHQRRAQKTQAYQKKNAAQQSHNELHLPLAPSSTRETHGKEQAADGAAFEERLFALRQYSIALLSFSNFQIQPECGFHKWLVFFCKLQSFTNHLPSEQTEDSLSVI